MTYLAVLRLRKRSLAALPPRDHVTLLPLLHAGAKDYRRGEEEQERATPSSGFVYNQYVCWDNLKLGGRTIRLIVAFVQCFACQKLYKTDVQDIEKSIASSSCLLPQ